MADRHLPNDEPEPGLDLIPPEHLELEARLRDVRSSVATLAAQYAALPDGGDPDATSAAQPKAAAPIETALHELVREYASLCKHLGRAPESVVTEIKETVLTAAGNRRRVKGPMEGIVRWVVEGYYGV